MPTVRRIKNIKWDEDDLDDYYSDDSDPFEPSSSRIDPRKNVKTKQTEPPKSVAKNIQIKQKTKIDTTKKNTDSVPFRNPLNVVVCGAVDAGKSTLLGHILSLTNCVDAKLKNVKNYAWILDQGEDERERNITIDPTKCQFNLPLPKGSNPLNYKSIKVNIIDTPGHHDLMHNLILGAVFANSAIIIIDSNDVLKGSAFDRYFNEHLLLLYFIGIRYFIICINKIDKFDYSSKVYTDIVNHISTLSKIYSKDSKIIYVPVSGLQGVNLTQVPEDAMNWYSGPSLLQALEEVAIDLISKPVVVYNDRLLCHIFDLWEVGKTNISCSCFVEGNEMKVPVNMVVLPNAVEVKCSKVSFSEVEDVSCGKAIMNSLSDLTCRMGNVSIDTKMEGSQGAVPKYLNDFVDNIQLKGAEIINLIPTALMVDCDTFSRIKTNNSSIRQQKILNLFVFISKHTQQKLTLGETVELYVGYSKDCAVITSVSKILEGNDIKKLKKVFSLNPGEFGFIGFSCCNTPLFVEPLSQNHSYINKTISLLSDIEHEVTESSEPIGLLSRALVRCGGNVIAGGIICHNFT
ncbi:elongation factor Tu family member [Theileria equi strain WA]|uniref:Elongation factor Tu family member n=1 Tax=Theileria equi strain WA TaxID=1537102 RepID=L0B222_THEEQ|nr:elongation factor Tu family member [Theileria equi strain WA]AFZ81296.1 elongation factor Tu family member [Theileria equi strain WA]|eukprot:XP_004830962.1 elongation factor Tu family member [Theileria equi strain WA]